MFTLRDWQKNPKYKPNLIVNASAIDMSDSLQPFPIGMCFQYIKYQNLETQIGQHENTVFCGIRDYSDTNRRSESNNRSTIVRKLSSNGIQNTILPSSEYFTSLPKYKFVISPEGNGVDCHRHYEALMAGCIPVVEESEHIRSVYGNCPILYTTDYSEITPEYLLKKYDKMIDKTYDFSRLFISSYPPKQRESIKTNSSFWTQSVRPLDFNWKISNIFRS
jgi:hypothetical protein